ncbi:hypothetical protein B7R21_06415 [Subtercola boreus]|uniref:Uncharacterized protein n=1 Tax=Subtercola boreus TaxID=120213 RepID=A0A3E0VWW7_9MICO|nr:hypothetical protein [Subtercola boreus]RFA14574.1 hypothetical protein B7R21_06415 [Subtercola boreus]
MNDDITYEETLPCTRGCAWDSLVEGEAPRPKPARHGMFCDSCFYRLRHALELVPDLMANMRAQINGFGAAPIGERVSGGGDGSPAPLRVGPLDASDSLFAKLVLWTGSVSETLSVAPPRVSVWINLTEVQGSRVVTPERAHEISTELVGWFLDRLETIAALPLAVAFHDDLCYGYDDARGVFTLAGAYGVEPRPFRDADKRECPLCGQREVFVKFPDKLDPDLTVMCAACEWVAPPLQVDRILRTVAA